MQIPWEVDQYEWEGHVLAFSRMPAADEGGEKGPALVVNRPAQSSDCGIGRLNMDTIDVHPYLKHNRREEYRSVNAIDECFGDTAGDCNSYGYNIFYSSEIDFT